MDRLLKNALLRGCKAAGDYDPKEVMHHIEEELTMDECVQAEGFLTWVNENSLVRHFGHGNIDQLFEEYMSGAIR